MAFASLPPGLCCTAYGRSWAPLPDPKPWRVQQKLTRYTWIVGKNKRADKKGNIKKVAVVESQNRKTGQVTAKPVPETTAARLCNFIEKHVRANAMKYAGQNRAYASFEHHETATAAASMLGAKSISTG